MEIMVFEERLTKSYISCGQLDSAQLGMEIGDSPEDYVFLLTTEEWNEWLKLYLTLSKTVFATKILEARLEVLDNFVKTNASNPLSLICLLSAHPKISDIYKLGNLTPHVLGDCYAIFFAKEEQLMRRSEEVTRKIFQFREEQLKKPPLS